MQPRFFNASHQCQGASALFLPVSSLQYLLETHCNLQPPASAKKAQQLRAGLLQIVDARADPNHGPIPDKEELVLDELYIVERESQLLDYPKNLISWEVRFSPYTFAASSLMRSQISTTSARCSLAIAHDMACCLWQLHHTQASAGDDIHITVSHCWHCPCCPCRRVVVGQAILAMSLNFPRSAQKWRWCLLDAGQKRN